MGALLLGGGWRKCLGLRGARAAFSHWQKIQRCSSCLSQDLCHPRPVWEDGKALLVSCNALLHLLGCSAYQTFLSVHSIFMDMGVPKFSVGEVSKQQFEPVFCHLGTFVSAFGLHPGCLSTSEQPRSGNSSCTELACREKASQLSNSTCLTAVHSMAQGPGPLLTTTCSGPFRAM